MGTSRFAIYFVPQPDSTLARAGTAWLGSDIETGAAIAGTEGPAEIVAVPRRYGFHATLKPPFRLAAGTTNEDLHQAMAEFAAARAPVAVGHLTLASLGSFLALVPTVPSPELGALAADCVRDFDRFRASPDPTETARRQAAGLSPRQVALLERWGYPYVMDEFRFHMTLTGDVAETDRPALRAMLETRFVAACAEPVTIDALTLVVEPDPGADFVVAARLPLLG